MAGRRGTFGISRFTIAPDRTKFDPDLHPDHAPWVAPENGAEYLKIVKARTAGRGSGASSATAQLHTRGDKSWVSFATAHAGIAFQWGSYAMPRMLILSSTAAKFNKDSPSPKVKEAREKRVKQLKKDASQRLRDGINNDIKFSLSGPGQDQQKVADKVRDRIIAALKATPEGQPVTTTLPHHVLEKVKRPFRATETKRATKPGLRLLARLRNIESIRDLDNFTKRITAPSHRSGLDLATLARLRAIRRERRED